MVTSSQLDPRDSPLRPRSTCRPLPRWEGSAGLCFREIDAVFATRNRCSTTTTFIDTNQTESDSHPIQTLTTLLAEPIKYSNPAAASSTLTMQKWHIWCAFLINNLLRPAFLCHF